MIGPIDWQPPPRQLRWFAGLWFPLFVGLCALLAHRLGAPDQALLIAASVAGLQALLGLAHPPLIRPLFLGLMVLTWPIGFVMSWVVLAVIYYVILTPIGLVQRLAGRDSLRKRMDPSAETYLQPVESPDHKDSYFKTY